MVLCGGGSGSGSTIAGGIHLTYTSAPDSGQHLCNAHLQLHGVQIPEIRHVRHCRRAAAAPLHALELFGAYLSSSYALPVEAAVDIDEAAAPKGFRGPAS